jgi:Xaa-Pro aminopeptidase
MPGGIVLNDKEFQRRRKQLISMMGAGGIAILPAAPVRIRSRDVEYRYRQDSDFYYLTGFAEPQAVAVLAPGRSMGEYLLFCRERDPEKERWDGRRTGPEGATEEYGADDAFPIDDVDDILPGIMESCDRVYYTMGLYPDFDARIAEWVNSLRSGGSRGVHTPQEFVALDHLLHDMRLYKSRAEISAMRKAARIAVAAHTRAMKMVRPGLAEYEIEAEFTHEFRCHDARHAYMPIVGSGANACTLHYVENNARVADGELLLIDAGCEFDYYASDITRTIPVNGRFSPEQRAIYEVVLEAQLAAIDKVRKGNHWNDPHDAAVRAITRGLKRLGLLDGSLPRLIRDQAYKDFYMHRTGHWIGMDVHDVGDYKVGEEWRLLESGMVMTVEPGVYIPASRKVRARWRNIGVRIEDDVAVTSNGADVLTKGLAKEPDAIESLMQH